MVAPSLNLSLSMYSCSLESVPGWTCYTRLCKSIVLPEEQYTICWLTPLILLKNNVLAVEMVQSVLTRIMPEL